MEFSVRMLSRAGAEGLKDSILELIHRRRDTWERQRFPELMRLQDYFAFSRFAIEQKVLVFVCAANRHSGQYIGHPGFECYGGPSFVVSHESGPHAGLVAADPSDPRLVAALHAFPEPMPYDDYVRRLATSGLRVLGPEDGFLVVSPNGNRLHEGYRLHGVYEDDGEETAWRGGRGDKLRGILNRHLGAELVHFGPHDDWVDRNRVDVAGPFAGPLLPVVVFQADGQIDNYLNVDDVINDWFFGKRWAGLYPSISGSGS
jgi:hypothetical protein